MRGFVPKNGRSTKGGSLPLKIGARRLGKLMMRYLLGENGSNGLTAAADLTISHRGSFTAKAIGNGAGSHMKSDSRGNGAHSTDNECPGFLQKLIVERVAVD